MRMRKPSVGILLLVVLLVGCGGATATAVSTSLATSFPTSTVTAGAATSTATTPALTPTPIPTLMGSVSTIPPSTPATSGAQVVTVQGSDRVNVRATASPTAAVIALFGAGADVLVVGQDTTGSDGARWVHVQAGDRDGYIRSDLVSGPHASANALPTPVFLATRTATLPAPMIITPSTMSAVTPTNTPLALIPSTIPATTAIPPATATTMAAPMSMPTVASTKAASAVPQKLQGTGQKASPPISLNAGLTTFKMTHSGSSNFAVTILDKDAKTIDLLANVIGRYNGSTAIRVPTNGQYTLNVDADGAWTIEVLQPGKTEQASAVALPQTFTGMGPLVTPLFTSGGGALRLTMKHSGKSNFAVTVLDSKGNPIDLAANVIGAFDGSKVVRLPSQDAYVLVVEADGPWTIGANL